MPQNRRKNDCSERRLVVGRHKEYVVGDAGAVRFRKLALRYRWLPSLGL